MKDFKIAQIVPRNCLYTIMNNHYHMCLAHLVHEEGLDRGGTNDHRYTDFYRRMSCEGKYVLMDNGAAEKAQLDNKSLLAAYEKVNPTEIVVPDTLLKCASTLEKSKRFIDDYGDILPYKFMGVPQGRDLSEWLVCAEQMVRCNRINTIGVSKFLNIVTGDPFVRYYAASAVQSMADSYGRKDLEIHLLGCDEGPAIVRCIKTLVPMVRGCDSAFAYITANSGQAIDEGTQRPEGEIDFLDGSEPRGLKFFLNDMETACGVHDNTASLAWR